MNPHHLYRIYISHAWQHVGSYNALVAMLRRESDLVWHDLSVPKRVSVASWDFGMPGREVIKYIQSADLVLVIAGVYARESDWISLETRLAGEMSKPIVVVSPGPPSDVPALPGVRTAATVGWEAGEIARAVRLHARCEQDQAAAHAA